MLAYVTANPISLSNGVMSEPFSEFLIFCQATVTTIWLSLVDKAIKLIDDEFSYLLIA